MIPNNSKIVRRYAVNLAMLLNNISKNLYRLKTSHLNRSIKNGVNKLQKCQLLSLNDEKLLTRNVNELNNITKRFYNDNSAQNLGSPNIRLPALTDDPVIIAPTFFSLLSNAYYFHGIIRRQIDRSFQFETFVEGSKQAVEMISHALAVEDFESLEGLVTSNVLNTLRERISRLSEAQKELIPVKKEEIFGQFAHQVTVDYEDERDIKKTFVNITMVYYSIKGLNLLQNQESERGMRFMTEHQDKVYISNYRFRRDYTDGPDSSSWIVTMCNEFNLSTIKSL